MSAEKDAGKRGPATPVDAGGSGSSGFSAAEKAAMRERAQELKVESGHAPHAKKDGERDVLAKIAEMSEPDRQMARRVHELVRTRAPTLAPKTWHGMPAYALDGKVVCFFQGAEKSDSRYSTLGFTDAAALDEGDMWPTSFALKEMTPATEKKIVALMEKATRTPRL